MSFTNKMLHIFHPALASYLQDGSAKPPEAIGEQGKEGWVIFEEKEKKVEGYFCYFLRDGNVWSLWWASLLLPGRAMCSLVPVCMYVYICIIMVCVCI